MTFTRIDDYRNFANQAIEISRKFEAELMKKLTAGSSIQIVVNPRSSLHLAIKERDEDGS